MQSEVFPQIWLFLCGYELRIEYLRELRGIIGENRLPVKREREAREGGDLALVDYDLCSGYIVLYVPSGSSIPT